MSMIRTSHCTPAAPSVTPIPALDVRSHARMQFADAEGARMLASLAVTHASGDDPLASEDVLPASVARMIASLYPEEHRLSTAVTNALEGISRRAMAAAGFTKEDIAYKFFRDYVEQCDARRMYCAFLIGLAAGARVSANG